MMLENTKLFGLLFVRPLNAMSEIVDRGSALFAVVAVLAVTLLVQIGVGSIWRTELLSNPALRVAVQTNTSPATPPEGPYDGLAETFMPPLSGSLWWAAQFSFYTPLFLLAVFYVPGVLLVGSFLEERGRVGLVFQRDYVALFTCCALGWSAAFLPAGAALAAAGAFALPVPAMLGILAAGLLYFTFLTVCAARTVFGSEYGKAISMATLSWLALGAGVFLEAFTSALWILASPCLVYYAYIFFSGDVRDLGNVFRNRQSFRRNLEISTINPHDSDAQYQLGLIYQQRRQKDQAAARFRKAIEANPGETDAHFQLGRIAREEGRLEEALSCFQTVIDQDDRHSLSEIWREIGVLYLTTGRYDFARQSLERFIERRPYDAEGLYYLGQTLNALGDSDRAGEMYRQAIEAARTAPSHRRNSTRPWSRLAEKELRKQPKHTAATSGD